MKSNGFFWVRAVVAFPTFTSLLLLRSNGSFKGELFALITLTLQNVWGGLQSWLGCRWKSLTLTLIVLPFLLHMCPCAWVRHMAYDWQDKTVLMASSRCEYSHFFNITCLSPDCSAMTTPISSNPPIYLPLCNLQSELLDCGGTLAAWIWFIPPKLFYSLPKWLREPLAPSKSTPCSLNSALNMDHTIFFKAYLNAKWVSDIPYSVDSMYPIIHFEKKCTLSGP